MIVSAKRARQINNYHHQLGEGIGLEDAPPPLVESRSKNYLTMAMEEIARGKLRFSYGAPRPVVSRSGIRRADLRRLIPPAAGRPKGARFAVATASGPSTASVGWRRAQCAVARIFVGVTGGIAAYKACELVRLLVRAGHDVTPITTAGAERFVAAETFWALARKERPPTRIRTSPRPTSSSWRRSPRTPSLGSRTAMPTTS